MSESLDLRELAFQHLRTRFPITEVGRKGAMICLQVGLSEDAVMCISINNPEVPSYDVLYPKNRISNDGSRQLEAALANRVLLEGLQWIADQLHQNGSVTTEFPV